MKNEALKSFLFKIQINRKIDFTKFIFYNRNIVALIIAIYFSSYGEKYFMAAFFCYGFYIYNGYKKSRLSFDSKISKIDTGNFYNIKSKITMQVYKKNTFLLTELLFADLFINGVEKTKKRKNK